MYKLYIVLITGLFINGLTGIGYAQATDYDTNSPAVTLWDQAVDELRMTTYDMAEENTRLEAEHQLLEEEMINRQVLIAEYQNEKRRLERDNNNVRYLIRKRRAHQKSLRRNIDTIEMDMDHMDAESERLRQKISVLNKKKKLWDLMFVDLKYKENDLLFQKDLTKLGQPDGGRSPAVDMAITVESSPEDKAVRRLEEENRKLAAEIGRLRAQKESVEAGIADFKARDLELVDLELEESQQAEYSAKIREIEQLKIAILSLQTEITHIENTISSAWDLYARRRDLLDTQIALDGRNQLLRNRIAQLTQEIEVLGQELSTLTQSR